jgi:hypothetical protein
MAIEMLSAEQLSTMTPEQLKAIVEQAMAVAKAAQSKISAAAAAEKAKQSAEARQELEGKLREAIKLPNLGENTLKAISEAGATACTISYVLEGENAGQGILSLVFKAARGSRGTKKEGTSTSGRAPAKNLSGDYEANTTDEEKAEDTANIEARVSAAMAKGSFHGDAVAARSSIGWQIMTARLHRNSIVGY